MVIWVEKMSSSSTPQQAGWCGTGWFPVWLSVAPLYSLTDLLSNRNLGSYGTLPTSISLRNLERVQSTSSLFKKWLSIRPASTSFPIWMKSIQLEVHSHPKVLNSCTSISKPIFVWLPSLAVQISFRYLQGIITQYRFTRVKFRVDALVWPSNRGLIKVKVYIARAVTWFV